MNHASAFAIPAEAGTHFTYAEGMEDWVVRGTYSLFLVWWLCRGEACPREKKKNKIYLPIRLVVRKGFSPSTLATIHTLKQK